MGKLKKRVGEERISDKFNIARRSWGVWGVDGTFTRLITG
jgi:hypothetical protein